LSSERELSEYGKHHRGIPWEKQIGGKKNGAIFTGKGKKIGVGAWEEKKLHGKQTSLHKKKMCTAGKRKGSGEKEKRQREEEKGKLLTRG